MLPIRLFSLLLFLILPCRTLQATSASVNSSQTTPPDVFVSVLQVGDQIEGLRKYMGRPRITPLSVTVSNASPFDVYFQAKTLFTKSNRLLFEVKRESLDPPVTPKTNIQPADVLFLVRKSANTLQMIADFLGARLNPEKYTIDNSKTPSDVFMAITTLNRQLNQLLSRRFSPSDVFEELTLAIGYSEILLNQFPKAKPIPSPPPFIAFKTPSDVYFRLENCTNIISSIYHRARLPTLTFQGKQAQPGAISPSDVYDIASLIVSRLAYLHRAENCNRQPMEPFYPGLKFPSHVFQQAGILEQQLIQLSRLQTPVSEVTGRNR